MAAPCFGLLLKATGILGTRLISKRCFDGVYASVPSVAGEEDGSGSLDLFEVDVESCGSVATLGVTELFVMEKTWSGITFPFLC
jgi:hypothetical protein